MKKGLPQQRRHKILEIRISSVWLEIFVSGGEGGIRISSPQWGRVNPNAKRPTNGAFFWRRGRDSNIIPSMGTREPKHKTPHKRGVLLAERAGFEPANLCGLHAFQACALSRTTRPLLVQATGLYHINFFLLGSLLWYFPLIDG